MTAGISRTKLLLKDSAFVFATNVSSTLFASAPEIWQVACRGKKRNLTHTWTKMQNNARSFQGTLKAWKTLAEFCPRDQPKTFPWAFFFWKYRFMVYCFCLSGTIFPQRPLFGVSSGGKRIQMTQDLPQGIMVPSSKQWIGTGVLTQLCDISLTVPPMKHRHCQVK